MFSKTQRFSILLLCIVVNGCQRDSDTSNVSSSGSSNEVSQSQSPTNQVINSLWENPIELCSALRDDGLASTGWQASDGEWYSDSNYQDIGASGGRVPANLSFAVFGTSENRAVKVQLVLNVNNPDTRQLGLDRLAAVTKELLRKFGVELSATLESSIKRGESFSQEDVKMRLALKIEQTKVEIFVIELSDSSQPPRHFEFE